MQRERQKKSARPCADGLTAKNHMVAEYGERYRAVIAMMQGRMKIFCETLAKYDECCYYK